MPEKTTSETGDWTREEIIKLWPQANYEVLNWLSRQGPVLRHLNSTWLSN